MQIQYQSKNTYNILVAFIVLFLTNKLVKNIVYKGNPNINIRQNNISLILLVLFILWNQLLKKLYMYNANLSFFLGFVLANLEKIFKTV